MTLQGWQEAVARSASDERLAELMAQLLHEQDQAKNELRKKGYGCTGMPWLDLVAEVPEC